MSVTLISYTKPVIDGVDAVEELVAYCARVSNPNNQLSMETASKLVAYLIRNKHWSPLEMVDITFEIKTTRDIGRQLLRHRSFCFQEFSQRYAKVAHFSNREARLQDTKNRQNSLETDDEELQEWWQDVQDAISENSEYLYEMALNMGIAKEVARAILPEGLTESTLYMKGSLRSWIHFLEIRQANGSQKEIRVLADAIAYQLKDIFPSVFEALISPTVD